MHGETASKNLMESSSPISTTPLFKHTACPSPISILHQPLYQPFLVLQSSSSSSSSRIESDMGAADKASSVQFEDFLPSMARKLGVEGLIQELCKGFQLLMDPRAGKITFQSLMRNAARLGLSELRDDELSEMMREGDLDGDGMLDHKEFCILMVRLSPELMDEESHRVFQC